MPYTWITFATGRQQLAQRLAVPSNAFWTDAELALYLQEALRVWNALTFTWKTTFTFGVAAASSAVWYSTGTMAGSPRTRGLSDAALYTAMQMHLLEPSTGGIWAGTSQFSIADFSQALQRTRDELIQYTSCNCQVLPGLEITPRARNVAIPDNVLDVQRVRWLPIGGPNTVLLRTDQTAQGYFDSGYLQAPAGTPTQYDVADTLPLGFRVDIPPVQPGTFEAMVSAAGAVFAPPIASPLSVPDDMAWLLKWGALGDLLARDSEATDLVRATWCKQRYGDGLKLFESTPWLMQAAINDVPAEIVSVAEMDSYSVGWQDGPPDYSTIIVGGMDFFTVVPDPKQALSVTLTVLANAPVPTADGDFIQCSRDDWDAVLDYAQFLAAWKQGGGEFSQALALEKRFVAAAMVKNARLAKLGLFTNLFAQQGQRQDREQERLPQG